MRGLLKMVVVGALLTSFTGCGDDVGSHGALVGGRCTTDAQCAKRCVTGDTFPGGYCSSTCSSDPDCPEGSLCFDVKGGVCLVPCRQAPDCSGFGPLYQCNDLDRKGTDGKALACLAGK